MANHLSTKPLSFYKVAEESDALWSEDGQEYHRKTPRHRVEGRWIIRRGGSVVRHEFIPDRPNPATRNNHEYNNRSSEAWGN
jgi:hypothetical protein